MNLFEVFAKLSLDTSDYDKGLDESQGKAKDFGKTLKSGFVGATKVAAAGVTALAGGITAGVAALNSIAGATEEYRVAMGKLGTAFESVGMSQETANQAYTEFYKILGDTDTATEASQLLARLARSEEDVTKWTSIAAGVAGTFGDALPIEGLIESANETAKVGQVAGSLADALNWVGLTADDLGLKLKANTKENKEWNKAITEGASAEDLFNMALSECSTEQERNALIMDTLKSKYDDATKSFYKNNEAIVKQRENQASLDASLAKVGESVQNVKNRILGDFMPAIAVLADGFSGLLDGDSGSIKKITDGISQFATKILEAAPQMVEVGLGIITALGTAIIDNLPLLTESAFELIGKLGTYLFESLPKLVETAMQILTFLATSLAENAPTMIPHIVEIIMQVAETLTAPNTLGLLITAAVQLIVAIVQGLAQALPILIEYVPTIVANIVQVLADNFPVLLQAGMDIIFAIRNGIIDSIPNIVNGILQVNQSITATIWNLISSASTWGADLIDNFVNGIKNSIGKVTNAIASVAGTVSDYIHFSEPDKGPLSNFHTFAPDMIDLFVKGIKDNEKKIADQMNSSLGLFDAGEITGTLNANVSRETSGAVPRLAGATININVQGMSIASDYDSVRFAERVSEVLKNLSLQESAAVGGAF